MAKNEQVKRLIEALVQKEVRRLLPEAVKQVLGGIISEAVIDLSSAPQAPVGNSHKRRAITESTGHEDWPTLGGGVMGSDRLAEMIGYGDLRPNGDGSRGGITLDHALTESGNPIPIDPRSIPKEVQDALSRDYTDLVKAWSKKKNGN